MSRLICTIGTFLFFCSTLLIAQQIDSEQLLKDIQVISSPEMEGRRTLEPGNVKAQQYIQQRFKELGLASQFKDYLQFFDFTYRRSGKRYERAANIVGFVAGAETEKLIVVTAHYDHIGKNGETVFHGADDNASGVAALLSFADFFSKHRPQHSMMFVALDAEELGLQGASALVSDFPFPLETVVLNINLDMVSRSVENQLFAVGTSHYPHLRPILERIGKGKQPQLVFGHDTPGKGDWSMSSDHAKFHEKGIPFVYFGVEDHEDYHKPTDTFERIQPEFFVNAATLILEILVALDDELLEED